MDINIQKAIENDESIQAGMKEYNAIDQKANEVAEEICKAVVEAIIKDNEKFSITTAILAISKCLGCLASYLYNSEEEFLIDVKKARQAIVSDVIPALLDPEPCGVCDNCKDGNPEDCINPNIRGDYTTSRFLPLLSQMLIEYDLFNKILYMNIKDREDVEQQNSFDFKSETDVAPEIKMSKTDVASEESETEVAFEKEMNQDGN